MKKLSVFINCILLSVSAFSQAGDVMTVHYINVGQAQSMVLEFPKGAVLIDAGAQPEMKENVHQFLDKFFDRRKDLNRTLNTVFVTHQHIDHDMALLDVAEHFTILNYIDNGHNNPKGSGVRQLLMQQYKGELGIKYEAITFNKVTKGNNKKGYTDEFIDAVDADGGGTDPEILVYSGAFAEGQVSDPKENNHSLIIKVIFGKSSFLFTGDLETAGITKVLSWYEGEPKALKADVLQIGHHGSANATTNDWISAISPKYAVINVGNWTFGLNPDDSTSTKFTTYAYGHPNKKAIDILEAHIPGLLDKPIKQHIGIKGQDPTDYTKTPMFRMATIKHNIYATDWNGNISIKADKNAHYTVVTER
jgi:competence protein ComEC